MIYRRDIDGLRALAVISVILFHLGYLPNGYLGVDVFFVISGYLITSIVYPEAAENVFSVLKFYERRVRRIMPLLLFVSAITLLAGIVYMLPNELKNLSQSVVAGNFSVNNILMYFTSEDYWADSNDYKPLMHTWSLGVEEQFYLLYPFLFFVCKGKRIKYIRHILLVLTLTSLTGFFIETKVAARFFFIQYRFFEMAIGGLCAIYFSQKSLSGRGVRIALYMSSCLLFALLVAPEFSTNEVKVLLTTALTATLLTTGNFLFKEDKLYSGFFSNPVVSFIGKISFSLYMWHQVVFAMARYSFLEFITIQWALVLVGITFLLSVASYYVVENVFRNRKVLKTKSMLWITGLLFVFTTTAALYVYEMNGIVKDYPELGLSKSSLASGNPQSDYILYNENVRLMDVPFTNTNRTKVLVIGNSFGRDATNILLESRAGKNSELRYFDIARIFSEASIAQRIEKADVIFIAAKDFLSERFIQDLENKYSIKIEHGKIWIFGTKNYGFSNGIHYRKIKNNRDYAGYRTVVKSYIAAENVKLKEEWKDRYIDLITPFCDKDGKIIVFTPEGRFISIDTIHLTRDGAVFYADYFNDLLDSILKK